MPQPISALDLNRFLSIAEALAVLNDITDLRNKILEVLNVDECAVHKLGLHHFSADRDVVSVIVVGKRVTVNLSSKAFAPVRRIHERRVQM